jgi:hypothetical protein
VEDQVMRLIAALSNIFWFVFGLILIDVVLR